MGLNAKGFRRVLIGEKMPDKNDPKYKERYERDVELGKKFSEKTGFTALMVKLQLWANDNKKTFLISVFIFVIVFFLINVFSFISAFRSSQDAGLRKNAVEEVHKAMQNKRHNIPQEY